MSPATTAIQAAINACARTGGGTVVIPPGRYLCGTLELRDDVELHLMQNAVLLASRQDEDYRSRDLPVLIHGQNLKNVAITGPGMLDGRAEHEWRETASVDSFITAETHNARQAGVEMRRPFAKPPKISLVSLTNCHGIRLAGFSALRSPHWTIHLAACREVEVDGLRIESSLTEGVNSDGFDIDGCSGVTVRDCRIATGDDAICLKSTRFGAGGASCTDVLIENCTLTSTSCALKIGTESFGDFRRIIFRDCVIRDSNRGLGIFVRDGGTVSDVLFSNISIECNRKHYNWWGDGDPLRFVVLKRGPDSKIGRIENVRVEKVSARGQGTSLIAGFGTGREIADISLRDVSFTLEAETAPDKRATHGLTVRDAQDIRLEGVTIGWDDAMGCEPKWASGLSVDRVDRLQTEDCEIASAPGSEAPAVRRVGNAVDLVRPLAGTATPRYDYFAAAARPFGMVSLSPDTRHGDLWNSGYRYGDDRILCFSHIHNIQLAGIPVMPATGESRGHLGMKANAASFCRETEVARPGYHRIDLTDRDITVELTATCRVGLHRYTFSETRAARLDFDIGESIGMTGIEHAAATLVSDREVEGSVVMSPTYRRKVPCTVYFVAQLDRAVTEFGAWLPGPDGKSVPFVPEDGAVAGVRSGFRLGFGELKKDETIQLKVAISYVSIEGARRNLLEELPGWDFDEVVANAAEEWSRFLGRIRVEGGTEMQREKFHTDLFRTGIGKRVWNDTDGRYVDRSGDSPVIRRLPLDAQGNPKFRLLDMDCLWGSQWNLNLIWLLAWPDVANDVAESFLEYFRHNGVMPRGVWGGRDSYVMVGDPATPLLAALASQGKAKFDTSTAFEAARKNAFPGGVRDRSGYEAVLEPTGGGMPDYVRLGYVPVEVQRQTTGWHSGGTALTLEYAWQDWCVAHLARILGKDQQTNRFFKRAGNYRNVFDPSTGWMRPRHADGSWMNGFEPVASDERQSPGFIEGNSAHYTFHVPQDVAGLARLMGGNEVFVRRLNECFENSAANGFHTPHGKHSRGWVEYGNQPSGAMAHLFNHAGAPWLSQKWVRKVHHSVFSSPTPDGAYPGDEDQGQLGALSALMSIGLFDVQGGVGESPDWELTVPLFDAIQIDVGGDRQLRIIVVREDSDDAYIQSASFNGQSVQGFSIPASDVAKGGELVIVAGPDPNRSWGVAR